MYCAETLSIVLSFVIDVHFVMVLLLAFPKMRQFPCPFGFCNSVRIYGRKINDDDDDDDDDSVISQNYLPNTHCYIPGTTCPTAGSHPSTCPMTQCHIPELLAHQHSVIPELLA